VEYFIKWIEVKPLVNIAAVGPKRFFGQNIICRFGVPQRDNSRQWQEIRLSLIQGILPSDGG
jgi:hypothetical protein